MIKYTQEQIAEEQKQLADEPVENFSQVASVCLYHIARDMKRIVLLLAEIRDK